MCVNSHLLRLNYMLVSSAKAPMYPASSLTSLFLFLFLNFLVKFYFFFNFYFILLYNTVLVLPYIDMNPPRVYMGRHVHP